LDLIGKDQVSFFYMKTSTNLIPFPSTSDDLDAIERIIFVGYPNGMYDRKNYTPILRQGITATPFHLDYDGLPAFLIDASVFPGSSGSPVYSCRYALDGELTQVQLLGVSMGSL
jgi:V8-like Glu-specific endopeptidase